MKALIFLSSALGMIYASMRFAWVGYTVFFLFLLGGVFGVFCSIYRHLASNRLL